MSTKIEWTRGDDGTPGKTWNPVTGCTKVSPGCKNCYAEAVADRFWATQYPATFDGVSGLGGRPRRFTDVRTHPDRLDEPLRWKKPARIFVNSMSDLFHEDVPEEFIDRVFAVMASARWHTFQVLTKRPERMSAYCAALRWERLIECCNQNVYGEKHGIGAYSLASTHHKTAAARDRLYGTHDAFARLSKPPIPNVHLGVSVENQETADERIPLLLQTPAAVRFLSVEPMLSPVDLNQAAWGEGRPQHPLDIQARMVAPPGLNWRSGFLPLRALDWVIVGGESGPGARPCDVAWIRSIVAQCKAAGTPAFVKQLGARPMEATKLPFHSFEHWVAKAQTWLHVTDRCFDAKGRACLIGEDFMRARDEGTFPIAIHRELRLKNRKGGDMEEWPEDLRIREFPS